MIILGVYLNIISKYTTRYGVYYYICYMSEQKILMKKIIGFNL
jgi:hypothetical protein